MGKLNFKFENDEVKFAMQTNFDTKKWEKYLSKEVIFNALRKCSIYMLNEVKQRFIKERSPEGVRWKKHSSITKAGKGILKRTKQLMKSIVSSFYKDTLRISTPLKYGIIQQKGKTIRTTKKQDLWMWHNLFNQTGPIYLKKGRLIKIPARPFLGFNKGNATKVKSICLSEFKKSERMGT